MTKPNFIIIGAAKSGTTTLYKYLQRHSQIYLTKPKEPDFFSLDKNYAQGTEWYESLFIQALSHQFCGEASTTYSRLHRYPQTVERMSQMLPNVKLIYLMRHPVDRAYSFYVYRFKRSQQNASFLSERGDLITAKTFEEAISENREFVESSYYLEQINRYLKFYQRSSLLCLLMEDLIKQPEATLKNILDFIGVDSNIDIFQDNKIVANQGEDYPDWFVKRQIIAPLKVIPGSQYLRSALPKNIKMLSYQFLKKIKYNFWQSQQYIPPSMLSDTRQMLINKFRNPNQELAEFLNRDLSHWNQ